MTCPDLVFTSGNNVWGLGTWDGGTKISLRFTTGYIATYSFPAFTFLYSRHFPSTVSGYSGTITNMAVTDDGHAFIWVRLSSESIYRLYDHNIAAGTTTLAWSSSWTGGIAGPAWNPNDNGLYELLDATGGLYELYRWDAANVAAGPTLVESYSTVYGFNRGDMCAFTLDGGVWFELGLEGDAGGLQYPHRYEAGSTTVATGVSTGSAKGLVPRTADSVFSSISGGVHVFSDGSSEASDCPLFASNGTNRVHTGVNGLTTFLYPTSGGVGTKVYAITATSPTVAHWSFGHIGWRG